MPELEPETELKKLPNSSGGKQNGFGDSKGTYRGDLINKEDLTKPVHPGIQNADHANFPHYNIKLPNGKKAAIIVLNR